MAPQIIWICLVFFAFGVSLAQHGKPKDGNHSVFITLFAILVHGSLLYWGGFFDKLF